MAFNRGIAVVFVALSLAAQSGETFKARLSPVPADAKTRADLAGSGSASATLTGTKLAVTGSFDGLRSSATTASLLGAIGPGVRGPVISDLTISKSTSGAISGAIELTPQQITSLRKGGLYVQISGEKAPEGVLWGWLLK
jgi:CHRD domain